MSVVICSYNGEEVIGRAIESLLAQDYPRDRFEILVVNDGSADATGKIAQSYPIKYLQHDKNRGISAARNTGLSQVTGDVYVSFDDDCVVPKNWLSELAKGYEQPRIAGVASVLVSPTKVQGLADHYMVAIGSGNPPTLDTNAQNHWTKRLSTYISSHFKPAKQQTGTIYAVGLINGATASFPIHILKSVGGWNEAMNAIEDTELCRRISDKFPLNRYYAVSTAEMIHDPKLTIAQLMKRQLNRGAINLAYYRQYKLTPPLFPFPIA